jgi:hypothetical protein
MVMVMDTDAVTVTVTTVTKPEVLSGLDGSPVATPETRSRSASLAGA